MILSGEYPPQRGGVADHSRSVAEGLAARGTEVHVIAPESAGLRSSASVHVHGLPDGFGRRGLRVLDAVLATLPRPRRLLVQYVPHAFGFKALNLGLCRWLYAQRERETIWTYFHEVAFPFARPAWKRTNLIAGGHRAMAALVVRASARRLITTPRWGELLAEVASLERYPCTWVPVPSNVGTSADPAAVAQLRARVASGAPLVGHFGTYGRLIAPLLRAALPRVLQSVPEARLLLAGRGSADFARELGQAHPALAPRICGLGGLPPDEVPTALAACDLLLQPYEDGVCCRRGSLMAALALGCCVLTNEGEASEGLWREAQATALCSLDPVALAAEAESLLSDPEGRAAIGARAAALYEERFALRHTLDALTSEDP